MTAIGLSELFLDGGHFCYLWSVAFIHAAFHAPMRHARTYLASFYGARRTAARVQC